jgi:uncharacterized protein YecT (DUF1311 family)
MKRRLGYLIFGFFLGSGSLVCSAQNSGHSQPCFDKAKTQAELDVCASEEAKRADAEMNRAYQRLLAKVSTDSNARDKIVSSQRAWLIYRDSYIAAMYPADDKQMAYGTMFPMEVDLLIADMTRSQTKAILELLRNYQPPN